ncbi:NAD/NADP-dependent octopine/nopaline dehydrogenase family protein [Arabiibacter massiliensis]|uniref:NAD/NADP-dependent octopine/nopaline dehydrogenase family protein n=1 Tax=Arabiibacter massiliensis TaxID=1870985 RepID=UPI0009BBF827|nr:NAD/NADP-dependent octopine/nopaline dehydrogenase family protein [Arabiibacter massiliensis]
MNITVIGGGNVGSLLAADCAKKGHAVTVFASDAPNWSANMDVFDADERLLFSAQLGCVTDKLDEAVRNADLIWVTYPLNALGSIAEELFPYTRSSQIIGITPGACGEFFFAEHVRRGCTLFGLQRVHSIARIKERGRSVYELGRKPEVQVATIPSSAVGDIGVLVEELLDTPAVRLPNYLVETLTPSNPILHTTRLKTMFSDWEPGKTYNRNILFYEEWDNESSDLLIACDEEVQNICQSLPLDLSGVVPLTEHYESPNAEAMTRKISGIPAYRGLTSPMKQIRPGEWVPDFDSRYFKADFGFGLAAIQKIARLAEADTPSIDGVLDWYRHVAEYEEAMETFPAVLGELINLYS